MKEEDLISKLEDLETPDIDLPGHRQALRAALINSDRFQRRTAIDWARVLAPVAAAVALIAFFGFVNLIQPELHTARAREIASTDAHVQALMTEHGLAIADVRLQDGEAFVLLAPRLVGRDAEELADEEKIEIDSYYSKGVPRIVSRLFGWAITPESASEPPRDLTPSAGDLPPCEEGLSHYYVIKVDLAEKTVSGFLEIDYAAVLHDMDLTGAYFTEAVLPRDIGGEEPEPDL